MTERLSDLVRFRGDKLFDGAVSISWFGSDEERARAASTAFVFHGPHYHGVQQEDIGTAHAHKLVDTATFTRSIVRQCYNTEEQPFTLAIAGYGTGKSHLGLTLATILSDPDGETAAAALEALDAADSEIGSEVRAVIKGGQKPCLVVALNGMKNFDLTAEVSYQISQELRRKGIDTKALEELRPRFRQAANLVKMSSEAIVHELLLSCDAENPADVIAALEDQDEETYSKVHQFFAKRGMAIQALAGESVRDVIGLTVKEYCGDGKPFQSLLVLFDEFGRYMEFATVRSQIAGSGVLQDLFEAIQDHADQASLVGFIQYELNAYVQRIASEYRNEVLRYVSRYQAARRLYLSINLETLVASILEKRKPELLESQFASSKFRQELARKQNSLLSWFPHARVHRLWSDPEQFQTIVGQGCWPLSPVSTWFLFSFAAGGKHLHQRSALSLLADAIARNWNADIPEGLDWSLAPVDLWSEGLLRELLTAEETAGHSSTAHAFASVSSRHEAQLSGSLNRVLCAVVIGSKLGLQAVDKPDASRALAALAGLTQEEANYAIRSLEEEFNVLEWVDTFKTFEIRGEALPRSQFLALLKQRIANTFDEAAKAQLFLRKAIEWSEKLTDVESEFADEHLINTREWRYQAVASTLDVLPMQIKLSSERWASALAVDAPRGTVIYCYVEPSRNRSNVEADVRRLLQAAAEEANVAALPILVVLLDDEEGKLGQTLAELAVLEEHLTSEERSRFGNLVPAHTEKLFQALNELLHQMLLNRYYCTGLEPEVTKSRLNRVATELFSRIYPQPLTFPFDGFKTARGNAADTCHELTAELLAGKLDFEGVIAKPVKSKNRAIAVLKDAWGVFSTDGRIAKRPSLPVLRTISSAWDDALSGSQGRLPVDTVFADLCRPPHGANIASAGLFLGVFVAPRIENLLVARDGKQFSVITWLQEDLFSGKFIDTKALRGIDLIPIGEASSEWENLLDEWEQEDSHTGRVSCVQRAEALKKRIPVPPSLVYRVIRLEDLARLSIRELSETDQRIEKALKEIEFGYRKRNVGHMSTGGQLLIEILGKIRREALFWTEAQIAEIEPHVERTRQGILMYFGEWLKNQAPRANTPAGVGDFRQELAKVARQLENLDLPELAQKTNQKADFIVKYFDLLAAATQLVRDVESWLTMNGRATEDVRVARLRELRHTGEDFSKKLQRMFEKAKVQRINEIRCELVGFLEKLSKAEQAACNRFAAIWDTELRSSSDLDSLLAEVLELTAVFDNVARDSEDLRQIRGVLQNYDAAYRRLDNQDLSWPEFESLVKDLKQSVGDFEHEEIPWKAEVVIKAFADEIGARRNGMASAWVDTLEAEAERVETMPVTEANVLLRRAQNPPAVYGEVHRERVKPIVQRIEQHLESRKLEWLLEEFGKLSPALRQKFLDRIATEHSVTKESSGAATTGEKRGVSAEQ